MSSNRNPDTPTPSYTMGAATSSQNCSTVGMRGSMPRICCRTLKRGLRVLDLGCGPGTISVGLAKVVEPGELHGIDMEESQIKIARAAATAGGHHNAVFRTGDVTRLSYEDDTFDVAHCHALLMHVRDTQAVLAEVKRVLKSGGLVSAREMIGSASFSEPELRRPCRCMGDILETARGQWRPSTDG